MSVRSPVAALVASPSALDWDFSTPLRALVTMSPKLSLEASVPATLVAAVVPGSAAAFERAPLAAALIAPIAIAISRAPGQPGRRRGHDRSWSGWPGRPAAQPSS